MGFMERVNASPVLWFAAAMLTAFSLGLGAYRGILEIAGLVAISGSELQRLESRDREANTMVKEIEDLKAASQMLSLYGPGFWFYWQIDLKRERGASETLFGINILVDNLFDKDDTTYARLHLTFEDIHLGRTRIPEASGTDPGFWGTWLSRPFPVELPIETGAKRHLCSENFDIIIAIEDASINSMRLGIAGMRPGSFAADRPVPLSSMKFGVDHECGPHPIYRGPTY